MKWLSLGQIARERTIFHGLSNGKLHAMRKIYYLKTCNTCLKILKELEPLEGVELREIKDNPINPEELDFMKNLAGSYEALFSRRAQLFRQRNLKTQQLSEQDYRNLILEHYTFLKRPVIVLDDRIFIGNAKKEVQEAKENLHS